MRVSKKDIDANKCVPDLKEVVKAQGIGFKKKRDKAAETKPSALSQSTNRTRLLNRVVAFYHQSFCEDGRALQYLQSRGITVLTTSL
jgi:hypothetical protein